MPQVQHHPTHYGNQNGKTKHDQAIDVLTVLGFVEGDDDDDEELWVWKGSKGWRFNRQWAVGVPHQP
jgi:hypothetical protein